MRTTIALIVFLTAGFFVSNKQVRVSKPAITSASLCEEEPEGFFKRDIVACETIGLDAE